MVLEEDSDGLDCDEVNIALMPIIYRKALQEHLLALQGTISGYEDKLKLMAETIGPFVREEIKIN